MLFLKQPLILLFLCHKSATTCQIDSNKVSSSKLRPDLCSCVKTEMIESTTPPQQPHKRGTIFLDSLYTGNTIEETKEKKIRVLDGFEHGILEGFQKLKALDFRVKDLNYDYRCGWTSDAIKIDDQMATNSHTYNV